MTELTLKHRGSPVDWPLLVALGLLMIIGAAFIYSATMVNATGAGQPWLKQEWIRQLMWYTIGLGAAGALCFVSYHSMARWSLVFYWGAILLLLLVLVPGVGTTRGWGARRWIDLGPFGLQPSEFAKLALIFVLGHFLSRPQEEVLDAKLFLKALGMTALPFALILKEPDLGSALTLFPIAFVMMFVAGVPPRFLRRVILGAVVIMGLILGDILFASEKWQLVKLEPYQKKRLLVFTGSECGL